MKDKLFAFGKTEIAKLQITKKDGEWQSTVEKERRSVVSIMPIVASVLQFPFFESSLTKNCSFVIGMSFFLFSGGNQLFLLST